MIHYNLCECKFMYNYHFPLNIYPVFFFKKDNVITSFIIFKFIEKAKSSPFQYSFYFIFYFSLPLKKYWLVYGWVWEEILKYNSLYVLISSLFLSSIFYNPYFFSFINNSKGLRGTRFYHVLMSQYDLGKTYYFILF